ncbi:MAG: nucleotidyltransferase domain-containing protein [Candidatus Njordarchaeales archaeon]
MREKVLRNWYKRVIYDDEHWTLLRLKREKAVKILELLDENNIKAYLYGSLARGDVKKTSDIDIIIFTPPPAYRLEYIIEEAFGRIYAREIVQATPRHAIKAHIYIDPETIITFPLTPLNNLEQEFYKFGGIIDLARARNYKNRVPGVDKRLVLIIPRDDGHVEYSIIGREEEVAKMLGISIDIVKERIYVLTRRDQIGRTGVFIKRVLSPDESFDTVLRELESKNPAVRRLIKSRGVII